MNISHTESSSEVSSIGLITETEEDVGQKEGVDNPWLKNITVVKSNFRNSKEKGRKG